MKNGEYLNDEIVDQVVGGVFQFFNGGTRCKVQGGKYTCDSSAQFEIINLINANPGVPESEIVTMAINQGILKPI